MAVDDISPVCDIDDPAGLLRALDEGAAARAEWTSLESFVASSLADGTTPALRAARKLLLAARRFRLAAGGSTARIDALLSAARAGLKRSPPR